MESDKLIKEETRAPCDSEQCVKVFELTFALLLTKSRCFEETSDTSSSKQYNKFIGNMFKVPSV